MNLLNLKLLKTKVKKIMFQIIKYLVVGDGACGGACGGACASGGACGAGGTTSGVYIFIFFLFIYLSLFRASCFILQNRVESYICVY